ncbi:MAG: tRNA 2-thiouridine(34) synthase MnmA [Chloroflexota bacterium]|nr:MAG: tRNA 2-thiouridine(34) synthase MnmA [Chloroflexota bacterium]
MSGGVDSSVAAALLVEEGYDVIGIMLRLWNEPGARRANRCCSPEAMTQAKRVCAILNIPFYAVDAQNVFYDQVVYPFIDDYLLGSTPNPCLNCNRHIRWEYLLDHAQAFGAEFMATGHYARVVQASNRLQLLKALDPSKDQSYVLHILNQNQLSHAVFPLGLLQKNEVRNIARELNLPVADRPESQDLCFLDDGDYRNFLRRNSNQPITEGDILNTQGEIIGKHTGIAMYTIGQRKGLGLSSPEPLYVIEKSRSDNTVVVGTKDELGQNRLWAKNVNWISIEPPGEPIQAKVKIRYKAKEVIATIKPIQSNAVEVVFDQKLLDITPGQAAVFYDGDICLGGGIIEKSAE